MLLCPNKDVCLHLDPCQRDQQGYSSNELSSRASRVLTDLGQIGCSILSLSIGTRASLDVTEFMTLKGERKREREEEGNKAIRGRRGVLKQYLAQFGSPHSGFDQK